ncbi:MAG: serine/threonine-protein kinase [Aquabacterium sp.]
MPTMTLPAVVGGWTLQRLLGRGGAAVVHQAVDSQGRQAALKLMALPPAEADPVADEALRRFEQEAVIGARLAHPHIVSPLGSGRDGPWAWIAFPLLAGGDLSAHGREPNLLPWQAVVSLATALLAALSHAHEQGVLHRDLKPANVLLGASGGHPQIADFGAARATDSEVTRSGLSVGTPAYMAPEALAGMDAGPRGDIYALGVMLYELLAGRLPFDETSMGALLRAVAAGQSPRLASVAPLAPVALVSWVEALMSRDPARRPPSARTALAQLRALSLRDIPQP